MFPWVTCAVAAEPGITRIEDISLQELLDGAVTMATRTNLPGRVTPNLVTVVTGDELVRLGARDLMDALRLLPALEPGVDVFGGVGFGVRGSWAFEGRTALIVDGIEWNEAEWSTTGPMANRIPAWMIDRIEVIRGPGSAVYGGTAELAVIQVTTLAGSDWTGARAQARTTWLPSGVYGRRDVGLALAGALGDTGRLAVQGHLGQGRESDDTYTDVYGRTEDLTDTSAQDPMIVDGRLKLGPLVLAGGYNRYHQTHRDAYDAIVNRTITVDSELAYASAEAHLDLGEDLSVAPKLAWIWSRPWMAREGLSPDHFLYANQWSHRLRGSLVTTFEPGETVELLGGAEATWDRGEIGDELPDFWLFDGQRYEDYWNVAGFAQAVDRLPIVTVTAGVRVDVHSLYGAAVAPRLALTRAWEHAHFKILASRAFRAPGLSLLRDEVWPEIAHTGEVEVGAGPTSALYFTASGWVTSISSPLLYVYEEGEDGEVWDGFRNDAARTGTAGTELELRSRWEFGELVIGYAGWTAAGFNAVDYFAVPDHRGPLLGLPQHKVVARGSLELGPHLDLGPTVTWIGPRWAVTSVDADDAAVSEQLPPAVLADLAINLRDAWFPGLVISLTGHDLLDANPGFAQPYDGRHAPLPGPGRELGLQVTFER